ncbi:hypothetical protein [Pseudoduganella aquatica]|uniref:hypothetical protein n=1 Tax=Pseudoduganella aquatica TaxID=2660641 RepID=UPI001E4F960B|nr:hypothetical protein [Pseudoduganella aquatica]
MGHDDYQQRKQQWLARIDGFYGQVQLWLARYAEKGQVKYDLHALVLTEEMLGTYTTRTLGISLGRQHVLLRTVGVMLDSSGGRMDLEGHRGIVRFVLPDLAADWKIATKAGEYPALEEFNEDNFFEALLEVSSD